MNYEVKQVRLSLGTHTKNMEKATMGCSETHRVSGMTGEFWKTKYLEEIQDVQIKKYFSVCWATLPRMMLGWPDITSQTDSLVVYDPGSSSRDLVKGPIFVTFSGYFL